jgi:hypothetical protein
MSETSFSFGEPVESAYPSVPNPSPAELMAKRVIQSLPKSKGAGRMPPGPRKKPTQPDEIRVVIAGEPKKWLRQTILAWPGPTIEWEDVRAALQKKYPTATWKRQSLYRHPVLRNAFRSAKLRLLTEREERNEKALIEAGKATRKSRPKAGTDEFFQDRIAFLEAHVDRLEKENAGLKQRFVRWQRNAARHGLPMERLDRDIAQIDRGQADE